jgi:putative GTP pyrophosphokinase
MTKAHPSYSAIDRLGEALARGVVTPEAVTELDAYRRTFGAAYEVVVRRLRMELQLAPTGRPAKTTASIIDKLRRETIRLSQMQDIAGCRVVVEDATQQDATEHRRSDSCTRV